MHTYLGRQAGIVCVPWVTILAHRCGIRVDRRRDVQRLHAIPTRISGLRGNDAKICGGTAIEVRRFPVSYNVRFRFEVTGQSAPSKVIMSWTTVFNDRILRGGMQGQGGARGSAVDRSAYISLHMQQRTNGSVDGAQRRGGPGFIPQ